MLMIPTSLLKLENFYIIFHLLTSCACKSLGNDVQNAKVHTGGKRLSPKQHPSEQDKPEWDWEEVGGGGVGGGYVMETYYMLEITLHYTLRCI